MALLYAIFAAKKNEQKNGVAMEKKITFALQYDDSAGYCVAVERNRQNTETGNASRHAGNRRALSCIFSVSRRLAMPFPPEGREGCAVFCLR